jgi:hypothetical protein
MSSTLRGLSIDAADIGDYLSIEVNVDQGFLIEWLLNLCLLSGRWQPSFTIVSIPKQAFTIVLSLDPRGEGRAEWTTSNAVILFDDEQLEAAIKLYRDLYTHGRSDTDHIELFFRPIPSAERNHLMLTLRGSGSRRHVRR